MIVLVLVQYCKRIRSLTQLFKEPPADPSPSPKSLISGSKSTTWMLRQLEVDGGLVLEDFILLPQKIFGILGEHLGVRGLRASLSLLEINCSIDIANFSYIFN